MVDIFTTRVLSLGSVIQLQGSFQKLLVIARALNVSNEGKQYFFDYGGVPYPDGLTGDQIAYFNRDQVARVIFEGYRDDDDAIVVDNIKRYEQENPQLQRFRLPRAGA